MTTTHPQRMTVDEYLVEAERRGWGRCVELEDGMVVELAAEHYLHVRSVQRVQEALVDVFGFQRVFASGTVRLDLWTAYQPDVFVLDDLDLPDLEPVPVRACRLAVEVAVSSLRRDLNAKARHYAAAGVREYWVIDPSADAGVLLRHVRPVDGAYRLVRRYEVGTGAERLDAAEVLADPSE
ncbi:MAG: Uma2 family endonuclease [Acidimicrobiales bacterium]|nr:Uma2 family endonuclease [Acidimicrobiales bacterium]